MTRFSRCAEARAHAEERYLFDGFKIRIVLRTVIAIPIFDIGDFSNIRCCICRKNQIISLWTYQLQPIFFDGFHYLHGHIFLKVVAKKESA